MSLHKFKKWEDESTNPTREVNLNANIEITAYYMQVSQMNYEPSESPSGTATITEPTTLTLDPLDVTAVKVETTTITGKLSDSAGNGIATKTIHFFVDDVDTTVSAVTDATGNFTFDYTWTEAGTFNYKVKYLGD